MQEAGWMLLLHRLPARRGSERVTIWRKLRKLGVLPLDTGGHLLPDRPALRERFGWLAEEIRQAGGEAALVLTSRIEGWPRERLVELFRQVRAKDYEGIARDLRVLRRKAGTGAGKGKKAAAAGPERLSAELERHRSGLAEIGKIDYFDCSAGAAARKLLNEAEALLRGASGGQRERALPRLAGADFRGRTWLTRPRPEIDRVGSAWLIRRFIDGKARFVFSPDPASAPEAIPFDLPGVEFSHHGDDCTFETLARRFGLADPSVVALAEMVHDADLEDGKFGRPEALGLDRALKGWALLGVPDEELLRRGGEAFEALYAWLGTTDPELP